MNKKWIIGGLDIGTTGCKIALFDEAGNNLQTFYREYAVSRTNNEHEMGFGVMQEAVFALLRDAAAEYPIDALGVTSFGETFALLDDQDTILAPSMLYTDPRGEEQVKAMCDAFTEEALIRKTGTCPHTMYSIAKLLWIKEEQPSIWQRAKRILLGEDFIVYTLTGVPQIDHSLAARTGAFDVRNKCWCEEILSYAGIDSSMLSRPVAAGTVAGLLKESVKKALEISYDITIVNGCHDQVAAMLGAGVFESNKAMDGTGTVECIPVVLDDYPEELSLYKKGYSVVPFLKDKFACYALSFTGGATLKWFRDTFAGAELQQAEQQGMNIYHLLDMAAKPAPTDLLVLPHFAGAATPYMDTGSKACILGMTLETDKMDIYKALMEGTAYEMRLNFSILKEHTGHIDEIRATGGGARSIVWLQIKADVLNTNITSLDCQEIGAAGTAALAGVAVGAFANMETAVGQMAPVGQVFVPHKENADRYAELFDNYQQLYTAVRRLV